MDVNEVKNLKWIPIEDWSALTTTSFNWYEEPFVGEADIESFVENVFKDIARKLNIPYTELEPVLRQENSAFYATKNRIFSRYSSVSKDHDCLIGLEKMLKIPDVSVIDFEFKYKNILFSRKRTLYLYIFQATT